MITELLYDKPVLAINKHGELVESYYPKYAWVGVIISPILRRYNKLLRWYIKFIIS